MNAKLRDALGIVFALAPVALVFAIAIIVFFARPAYPRDNGQWESTDAEIREWYRTLMQPDVPSVSCCGEADAYYADKVEVVDGKTYAYITDDRVIPNRPNIPNGTRVWVPDHKLKWDRGNPTGHAVIFLNTGLDVLCFVQGGGV